jgi:MHS family shikimate/dehydroshikimate transporter-like MFS transporter
MLDIALANESSEDAGAAHSRGLAKVLIASVIGSIVEWYDFLVYGTASALVFNKIFFPAFDPAVAIFAAFGAYAVGFVARPLGAVVFGHFGDRMGRKAMLTLTLLIMGIGTFLIGCLPTYGQIGVAAPVLLVILRLVQGLGIGGEWGGSILLAVEHAPKNRRGLFGSLVQLGYPIGVMLSIGAFALLAVLTPEQFLSWGWRVPFLVSIVLVAVGLFVRLRVAETPVFQQAIQRAEIARVPLFEILSRHRRSFFIAIGMKLSEIAWVSVATVFSITYVTGHLGMPKSVILNGILIAACAELITIPMFGWLSDRFGRRALFIVGCVFSMAFAFPMFTLLDTRDPVIIAITIGFAVSFGQGIMFGPEAAWMSELFPTRLRYSGASMGFQIGGALSGGFVPLGAALLLTWAGGATWGISWMLIVIAALTLIAALCAPETARREMDA